MAFQGWEEEENILNNTAVLVLGKSHRGIRLPPNMMLLLNAYVWWEWPLETIISETTTQNIPVLGKLRAVIAGSMEEHK